MFKVLIVSLLAICAYTTPVDNVAEKPKDAKAVPKSTEEQIKSEEGYKHKYQGHKNYDHGKQHYHHDKYDHKKYDHKKYKHETTTTTTTSTTTTTTELDRAVYITRVDTDSSSSLEVGTVYVQRNSGAFALIAESPISLETSQTLGGGIYSRFARGDSSVDGYDVEVYYQDNTTYGYYSSYNDNTTSTIAIYTNILNLSHDRDTESIVVSGIPDDAYVQGDESGSPQSTEIVLDSHSGIHKQTYNLDNERAECYDATYYPYMRTFCIQNNNDFGQIMIVDPLIGGTEFPPAGSDPAQIYDSTTPHGLTTTLLKQKVCKKQSRAYKMKVTHVALSGLVLSATPPAVTVQRAVFIETSPYFIQVSTILELAGTAQPPVLYSPPRTNRLLACYNNMLLIYDDEPYTTMEFPVVPSKVVHLAIASANTFNPTVCKGTFTLPTSPNDIWVWDGTTLAFSDDGATTFTVILTAEKFGGLVAFDFVDHYHKKY